LFCYFLRLFLCNVGNILLFSWDLQCYCCRKILIVDELLVFINFTIVIIFCKLLSNTHLFCLSTQRNGFLINSIKINYVVFCKKWYSPSMHNQVCLIYNDELHRPEYDVYATCKHFNMHFIQNFYCMLFVKLPPRRKCINGCKNYSRKLGCNLPLNLIFLYNAKTS
jgi:hypothetical protein